jgi:hypothetical protein
MGFKYGFRITLSIPFKNGRFKQIFSDRLFYNYPPTPWVKGERNHPFLIQPHIHLLEYSISTVPHSWLWYQTLCAEKEKRLVVAGVFGSLEETSDVLATANAHSAIQTDPGAT